MQIDSLLPFPVVVLWEAFLSCQQPWMGRPLLHHHQQQNQDPEQPKQRYYEKIYHPKKVLKASLFSF